MPPEIASFPYIQLGFAVSVVLVTLWMMIRGEKSKQQSSSELLRNSDSFQFPNTQVYLGGAFSQITNKLDRIAQELSIANDDARSDRDLNRQRFEDVKRSINEVIREMKEIADVVTFDSNVKRRR